MRYGYRELYQIGNHQWRQVIAGDLGITIHHSKWKDPALALQFNCKPDDTGKFRAKQWAMTGSDSTLWPYLEGFPVEIPDWPDIIKGKDAKVPRPEGSTAKAIQPDDRYDVSAMAEWMRRELETAGVIS